jgi:ribonuclease HI
MIVTINTDASWCPKTRDGGYCFWISSPWGRFKKHGKLRLKPMDSTAAEIMAMVNALYFLSKHKDLKTCSKIIFNTDCTFGINYIERGKGKVEQWNYPVKRFKEIRSKLKADLEFRDIKAHTQDLSEARMWVNDYCDKKAKEGRKL